MGGNSENLKIRNFGAFVQGQREKISIFTHEIKLKNRWSKNGVPSKKNVDKSTLKIDLRKTGAAKSARNIFSTL